MEWATLVGSAIGFAISPVTLIELILVLVSKRRVVNSIVLTIGIIVLSFVGVMIGVGGAKAVGDTSSGPSTATGIVFVLLAARAAGARGEELEEPGRRLGDGHLRQDRRPWGPMAVLVLAPGATLLNPKNLIILLSAGQSIGSASSGAGVILPALIFVVIATSPFWVATLYALWGGEAAERHLDALRLWLTAKNRLIMAVVLGVLGLVLLAKGISAVVAG